jgi:hypothetical protein
MKMIFAKVMHMCSSMCVKIIIIVKIEIKDLKNDKTIQLYSCIYFNLKKKTYRNKVATVKVLHVMTRSHWTITFQLCSPNNV